MNNNYKRLLAGLSPKEKRALLKQLLSKGAGGQLRKLVSDVEVMNVAELQVEAVLDPEISPEAVLPTFIVRPTVNGRVFEHSFSFLNCHGFVKQLVAA